jgi:hypothetical protein
MKLYKSIIFLSLVALATNLLTINLKVKAATSPVTITKFELDPADDLTDNMATINIEFSASTLNFGTITFVIVEGPVDSGNGYDILPHIIISSTQFVSNKYQTVQTVPVLYEGMSLVTCVYLVDSSAYTCPDEGVTTIEFTKITPEVPVYRFFNNKLGTHLYTADVNEKGDLQATNPLNESSEEWSYEGYKYFVFKDTTTYPEAVPVYRFFNTKEGGHVYTTSETEKTTIINTLPKYSFEGVKYYVGANSAEGFVPVYRFFNTKTGTHLYTISEAEKSTIISTLPQYSYEGVKFYVLEN